MGPAGTITDEGLLVAIGEGDRDALRELYDRHAAWLLLRLRRRGADGTLAEEVLQDTFLAVWRKPQSYSGTGPVAAWIWGIGIRRLIDRLRRTWALQPLARGREETVVSAEDEVLLGVEFGDLAGALASLSPELRAVIQATVLDGLTTREAARLLRIPAGTVKTRMMRARAQLREELT
ncbi:MAG TPA: RNA polymerase sigma factor [Actinomycetota bacterium]|nr:RNA polymerase sigma factor [Actinomycetota bacterium]